ncbi:MAG: acetyl esterase/lipase [Candidatus Pelagisphaera sp.]|jgi:acetyl esterase/lipase
MKIRIYFSLALAVCVFASANAELVEFKDLTFAKYGDRELKLDLYKPKNQSEALPAIVCIHGGGWKGGTKKHFGKHAKTLAESGYVVVSIDYRLSGEAPFPAHIMDCKAAVRWLRANADTYGVDPKRIGATGQSAGGHLAALLATSGGVAELEGDGGNAGFSSTIQAAVPMGAQSDLETDRIRSMTAQSGAAIWHAFLNGSLDENEALYQLASPRRHLDAEDPPMMFMTGGKDNMDTHASPIRADMRRLGISTGLLVIPGAPHPFLTNEQWRDLALNTAVFFFDQQFKPAAK